MPRPSPGPGEVQVEVEVCGVCRTDLHVVEGDLPERRPRIIPGHEVVGRVTRLGAGASRFSPGQRVGIAWLHAACGRCDYCRRGDENLCCAPRFTGWTDPGGYADALCAPEDFVYALPDGLDTAVAAPMLCAGIIGYRALVRSAVRPGEALGLYGFGASAHIVLQIARHWGCNVYVATRGDRHQALARDMGAVWVGGADAPPPVKLKAAILFAPVGELVPVVRGLDAAHAGAAGIHVLKLPNYRAHRRSSLQGGQYTADGENCCAWRPGFPCTRARKNFPWSRPIRHSSGCVTIRLPGRPCCASGKARNSINHKGAG
jgi:propanol-preferring alcohol dehydrogenase